MYSACIRCSKLGTVCKGPNFTDMSVPEIIDWMRSRIAYLGWTRTYLSELSGVPDGTVKRVLSSTDGGGFKFETVAPLLKALTGSSGAESPCPDPDGSIHDALTTRIRHLEQDLADTKAMAATAAEEHNRVVTYLKSQVRNHRTALIVTALLLVLVLLSVIGVLIYDVLSPNIGYFRG